MSSTRQCPTPWRGFVASLALAAALPSLSCEPPLPLEELNPPEAVSAAWEACDTAVDLHAAAYERLKAAAPDELAHYELAFFIEARAQKAWDESPSVPEIPGFTRDDSLSLGEQIFAETAAKRRWRERDPEAADDREALIRQKSATREARDAAEVALRRARRRLDEAATDEYAAYLVARDAVELAGLLVKATSRWHDEITALEACSP